MRKSIGIVSLLVIVTTLLLCGSSVSASGSSSAGIENGMAATAITEPATIEVRQIKPPIAGHFPTGLYKYPFKTNSYERNIFTQTIIWEPAVSATFQTNTEYTATLTIESTSQSFDAHGINLENITGLPARAMLRADIELSTETGNSKKLMITIPFLATTSKPSPAELIFHEDFSTAFNPDNTIGNEHAFMLASQDHRNDYCDWVDNMTSVSNGNLMLKFERNQSSAIRSGAVRTIGRGANWSNVTFENAFGYYEANIKFPEEAGVWGAFWLFNSQAMTPPLSKEEGGTKYSTEIDIVESWGGRLNNNPFSAALHAYRGGGITEGISKESNERVTGSNIYDGEFHKIGLEWSPGEYKFFVDGVMFWNIKDDNPYSANEGIMQNPAYMKLTVESAPWVMNDNRIKEQIRLDDPEDCVGEMLVDYVKVWNGPKPDETTQGVTITGKVESYGPKSAATVTLLFNGTVVDVVTLEAESGSGQVKQQFNFTNIIPGVYDIEIKKPAHAKYVIKSVVVGLEDLDLTKDPRPTVNLITLPCGDINNDGDINVTDLNILWSAANYNKGAADAVNPLADLNGDGDINVTDLNILWGVANYNKGKVVIDYSGGDF